MLSQHKCSNGHNAVENSANLGRAQRQQGELQRGGELAPDEDGTHTMIGERIEAGDITLDGPQQHRNFHREALCRFIQMNLDLSMHYSNVQNAS
ncbi:hypothetical protein HN51_032983 [Arachis hypogaea]